MASSGFTKYANLIIVRKNCRVNLMLIKEADYNWFVVEQNFWKSTKQNKHFSQQAGNNTANPPEELWLHNELYCFKKEDQEILHSKQCGLTILLWIQHKS